MNKTITATLFSLLLCCQLAVASPALEAEISNINQDLQHYALPQSLVSPPASVRKTQYLAEYFSPWNDQFRWQSAEAMKKLLTDVSNAYLNGQSWGVSRQPIDKAWLEQRVDAMQLDRFPNAGSNAITLRDTDLRLMPTHKPVYDDWAKPGEGHPFDYLQNSYVYANTPVYILHSSRDSAWHMVVVGDNSIGWLPADALVTVSKAVQKQFMREDYIAATVANQSLTTQNNAFVGRTHIGKIYPLVKTQKDHYWVQIIVNNGNGQGKVVQAKLATTAGAPFPLNFDPQSLAMLGNKLRNTPYGWGGMYGFLDCSALMQNVFAAHGIWLARNSRDQAQLSGEFVDLSGASREDKRRALKANGIPFMTLVYMPGHIGLYLGYDDKQLYLFHTPWALRTIPQGDDKYDGRDIIGRALVTTLTLGEHLPTVASTWLDKTTGYRVLL